MTSILRTFMLLHCAAGAPLPCQDAPEPPIVPGSEAMLCGAGDAFARKPISTMKLTGKGFEKRTLRDFAGSWIYLYTVTGLRDERIARVSEYCRQLESSGFIAIAALDFIQPDERPESAELDGCANHLLWLTMDKLRQAWKESKPLRRPIDNIYPETMLVDPAGFVALGGRIRDPLGVDQSQFEQKTFIPKLVTRHPGLTLADSKPGSPVRRSIAKRNWQAALKHAKTGELETQVHGIIDAQVAWAEAHVIEMKAPCVVTRLAALTHLPRGDERADDVKAMKLRRTRDKALQAAASFTKRILKVAYGMSSDLVYLKTHYSPREFKKHERELRKCEAEVKEFEQWDSSFMAVMTRRIRSVLEVRSPYRKCLNCEHPAHDCKCGR